MDGEVVGSIIKKGSWPVIAARLQRAFVGEEHQGLMGSRMYLRGGAVI